MKTTFRPRTKRLGQRRLRTNTLRLESLEMRCLLAGDLPVTADLPRLRLTVGTLVDEVDDDRSETDLSLREAVIEANAYLGDVTIVVPPGTYGLTLTGPDEDESLTGDLDITNREGMVRIEGIIDLQANGDESSVVSGVQADRLFQIHPDANVELNELRLIEGKISADFVGANGGAIHNASTLELRGVELTDNMTDGRGGAVFNSGQLTVADSTLRDNHSGAGGGGIFSNPQLVVSDSTLEGNSVGNQHNVGSGGGIYLSGDDGRASISRSELIANHADSFGGGLYSDATSVEITNSRLSLNSAGRGGGAMRVDDAVELHVVRSDFLENRAVEDGGAVLLKDGPGVFDNVDFQGNLAEGTGGALYALDASVRATDTMFENNEAIRGGGAYIDGDDSIGDGRSLAVDFIDTVFLDNQGTSGGGLYLTNVHADVEGSSFLNNEASRGGAVYVDTGELNITESDVRGNAARLFGGGIVNRGTVRLRSSKFELNRSEIAGGAVYSERGQFVAENSEFRFNSAVSDGGGIYTADTNVDLMDSTFSRNEAHSGAGLFLSGNQHVTGVGVEAHLSQITVFNNEASVGGGLRFSLSHLDATIENSTIRENRAEFGGGIAYFGGFLGGELRVANSQVIDNEATISGGGFRSEDSQLIVDQSTIDGNFAARGGAFHMGEDDEVTVVRSTVSNNRATAGPGGAFFVDEDHRLEILGSTISGNSSFDFGGAIHVWDNGFFVRVEHSTITGNVVNSDETGTGGGVFGLDNSALHFSHSIVAGNLSEPVLSARPSILEDFGGGTGPGSTFDFNLVGSAASDITDALRNGTGNQLGADPGLAPLADNGGPTLTHALRIDSPAINAGRESDSLNWYPDEQRGFERFVGVIDIGSVEMSVDDVRQQPPEDETFRVRDERATTWLESHVEPELFLQDLAVELVEDRMFVGYSSLNGLGPSTGIYEFHDGRWSEAARLATPRPDGRERNYSYAFSPDQVAMAERGLLDVEGEVFLFEDLPSGWQQTEAISPPVENIHDFGDELAIDETVLVIAGQTDANTGSGIAFVYELEDGTWRHRNTLTPPDDDESTTHAITSLALDGDRIAVTWSDFTSFPVEDTSEVAIYERFPSGWRRVDSILPDESFYLGSTSDLSGDRLLVSADFVEQEEGGEQYGAVLYQRNPTGWQRTGSLWVVDDEDWDDIDIDSISLDGDVAVIGVDHDDDPGAAYVFHRVSDQWVQTERLLSRDPARDEDNFFGVSLNDGNLAVSDREFNEVLVYGVADTADGRRVLRVGRSGVLGNDLFAGEIQASLVEQAQHGNVGLLPDGSFQYVVDESFVGEDSFHYVAVRDEFTSGRGTTTLQVGPVDPIVLEVIRNQGNNIYTEISELGFALSQDLSGRLKASSLLLYSDTRGEAIPHNEAPRYDTELNVATWSLWRLELPVGRYTATLDLRDAALERDFFTTEFIVTLPGDANLDGYVDGSDFNIWNDNKFTSGTDWQTGDWDLDFRTDANDLALWNTNRFLSIDSHEGAAVRVRVSQRRTSPRVPRAALADRAFAALPFEPLQILDRPTASSSRGNSSGVKQVSTTLEERSVDWTIRRRAERSVRVAHHVAMSGDNVDAQIADETQLVDGVLSKWHMFIR